MATGQVLWPFRSGPVDCACMPVPAWLARNPKKAERLGERITEMLREAGVLFMVFAPLDFVLGSGGDGRQAGAWSLLCVGLVLWLLGVVVEWFWRE